MESQICLAFAHINIIGKKYMHFEIEKRIKRRSRKTRKRRGEGGYYDLSLQLQKNVKGKFFWHDGF
jgi:hypothetical protein